MKDRELIATWDSNEMYYWCKELKKNRIQLLAIIEEVGNKVENVKKYIAEHE